MCVYWFKFVYPSRKTQSSFIVSYQVVEDPSPSLPDRDFSSELVDFCRCCLHKDAGQRLNYRDLEAHRFIQDHLHEDKRQIASFISLILDWLSLVGGALAPSLVSAITVLPSFTAWWYSLSTSVPRHHIKCSSGNFVYLVIINSLSFIVECQLVMRQVDKSLK